MVNLLAEMGIQVSGKGSLSLKKVNDYFRKVDTANPQPKGRAVKMMDLAPNGCKHYVSKTGAKEMLFCNDPQKKGYIYCDRHYEFAYGGGSLKSKFKGGPKPIWDEERLKAIRGVIDDGKFVTAKEITKEVNKRVGTNIGSSRLYAICRKHNIVLPLSQKAKGVKLSA